MRSQWPQDSSYKSKQGLMRRYPCFHVFRLGCWFRFQSRGVSRFWRLGLVVLQDHVRPQGSACVCIHPIACCLEELHGLWLDRSASHGFLGLLGADGSFLLLCARAFRKGGKVGQVQYRERPLLRHMMSVASRRHCWAMVQTPCCSKSTASWPEENFL